LYSEVKLAWREPVCLGGSDTVAQGAYAELAFLIQHILAGEVGQS
jgi:hypothetical protein